MEQHPKPLEHIREVVQDSSKNGYTVYHTAQLIPEHPVSVARVLYIQNRQPVLSEIFQHDFITAEPHHTLSGIKIIGGHMPKPDAYRRAELIKVLDDDLPAVFLTIGIQQGREPDLINQISSLFVKTDRLRPIITRPEGWWLMQHTI